MPALQHFFLQPLDVHFEPMDVPGANLLKQGIKRQNWNQSLPAPESALLVLACNFGICRREAGVLELEERQPFILVTDSQLEHRLVRTCSPQQSGVLLGRLDMHSSPAVLVKCKANRVDNRVLSTNIDIKAIFDVL